MTPKEDFLRSKPPLLPGFPEPSTPPPARISSVPSVGGVWIFSGITQCVKTLRIPCNLCSPLRNSEENMGFAPEGFLCFSPLSLKNSIFFTLTPKEFHHFSLLPLKNSHCSSTSGVQKFSGIAHLRPIYTVRFLLTIVACDFCSARCSRHGKIVYDFHDIKLPVATIVVGF